MVHRAPFFLTAFLGAIFFCYFLMGYTLIPAGDIAEYFGITQSLSTHASIALTNKDVQTLSTILHKEYFTNPGYYIAGVDGNKYPVHFIAYSFLLLPLRFMLERWSFSPLLTFPLTNLLILFFTILFCMRQFLHSTTKQFLFLILILFSPILSFISWPGPDLLVMCLLLLALCYVFTSHYSIAGTLIAFASWHSQPLVPLSVILTSIPLVQTIYTHHSLAHFSWKKIRSIFFVLVLIAIPYIYNIAVFGVLTPWTIFQDNWTIQNGFGIQNIHPQKLFEQFFDPNIGIFWYMPIGTLIGIGYICWKGYTKKMYWIIGIVTIMTACFFQTNPAWHYGTSGYGPTRHILFIIPLFITVGMQWFFSLRRNTILFYTLIIVYIGIQSIPLTWNGWLAPHFENTLSHSPVATFILTHYPLWYSPTPELFVDRTNHTDLDHLTTAIYTVNGVCKKAYIANGNIQPVLTQCGYLDTNATLVIRKHPFGNTYSTYNK